MFGECCSSQDWARAAPMGVLPAGGQRPGGDVLASWAEGLGRGQAAVRGRGCLRFAFYGRVPTEDWQDPVTSRARQLQQAVMLTAGCGVIVAEFFDTGESRPCRGTAPAGRRARGCADGSGPGWDAVVIGEYERAFYGNQGCPGRRSAGEQQRNSSALSAGRCVKDERWSSARSGTLAGSPQSFTSRPRPRRPAGWPSNAHCRQSVTVHDVGIFAQCWMW